MTSKHLESSLELCAERITFWWEYLKKMWFQTNIFINNTPIQALHLELGYNLLSLWFCTFSKSNHLKINSKQNNCYCMKLTVILLQQFNFIKTKEYRILAFNRPFRFSTLLSERNSKSWTISLLVLYTHVRYF